MKQHINLNQWDELTHDKKQILFDSGFKNDWKMNIGQMIEFLGEDLLLINRAVTFMGKDKFGFEVTHDKKITIMVESFDKLCDSLWEATKYKLNTI